MSTHTQTICGEFGTVYVLPWQVTVSGDSGQLYRWANRPDNRWPCSELSRRDSVSAWFDSNGLADLSVSPADSDDDLPADELNAWTADVLREVLPTDHPCYFVTVGQFEEN